jgi:hypothetical protein
LYSQTSESRRQERERERSDVYIEKSREADEMSGFRR